MIIDFNRMEATDIPNFKGGEKEFNVKMFWDGTNRIMKGKLIPGASIGEHTHEENCEKKDKRVVLHINEKNKKKFFKESNILTEFDTFRPAKEDDSERYAFLSVYENLEDDIVSVDKKIDSSDSPYLFGAPFTFKRSASS